MPRYIDADAFLKKIKRFSLSNGTTLGKHSGVADEIIDVLMAEPTANVVEVVRCKDCKFFKYGDYCTEGKMEHSRCREEDFCSCGKRKEDTKE